MNLKTRISEALQGRSAGSTGDSIDSEGLALKRQREELALRAHMRRLLVARNRELDELRTIMVKPRNRTTGAGSTELARGSPVAGITRPPPHTDGAQLVSLINELEVKVLSEPMGLTGLPAGGAPSLVATTTPGNSVLPSNGSPKADPLDDAALMVAARRWDHAADLLIKALCAGEVTRGADWATRSAIDLFERSGQAERAAAMRIQYFESRGRQPGRIVPPRLDAPVCGRLTVCNPVVWRCPARLDREVSAALDQLLNVSRRGLPLVIDWTAAEGIEPAAMADLRLSFEQAMKSQNIFVHVGLSRLIRALRRALKNQNFSRESWHLWLALLNWTGFRHAHHTGADAFSRRYPDEAPKFRTVRSISQPINLPEGHSATELVCAARFQGDLTRDHAEELDRLEVRAPMPGRLVLLDFRLLTSLDFFFGADLLNWVIRRHSRGEMVGIAYAHPLLAHFLQMLGLQNHAKLLGPLPAGAPK